MKDNFTDRKQIWLINMKMLILVIIQKMQIKTIITLYTHLMGEN